MANCQLFNSAEWLNVAGRTNALGVDGVSYEETFNSVEGLSVHIDQASFVHTMATASAARIARGLAAFAALS
jgi:hypothetical protein